MSLTKSRAVVLRSYRDKLVEAKIRAQEARDAAVLTLSGGALGISFAFIDHFVKGEPRYPTLLFLAWMSWGLSLVLHLLNYFLGDLAFDWQITETDKELTGKEFDEDAVNKADKGVTVITVVIMALFVIGVGLLGVFVLENYGPGCKVPASLQSSCDSHESGNITILETRRK